SVEAVLLTKCSTADGARERLAWRRLVVTRGPQRNNDRCERRFVAAFGLILRVEDVRFLHGSDGRLCFLSSSFKFFFTSCNICASRRSHESDGSAVSWLN